MPGPGGRRGTKALRTGLAAAATVLCLALGAVLLPGLLDRGGEENTSGAAGGPQSAASASEAAGTSSGAAVFPGADPGRTGDFGTAAADVSTRPKGWKVWHARVADGPVKCALAGASLVCADARRITVLDAADGKRRWRGPQTRTGSAPASVGAVLDTTVYAFEGDALVARALSGGREKWREPLPDGVRVADSVQSGDILYYATKAAGSGTGRLIAQRLTGDHQRVWDQAWQESADEAELLLADNRLVAVGEAVTVLKAADGTRQPGIRAGDLTCRTPVLKGRQLLCSGSEGLTIVDMEAPDKRRTAAPGVDIAYRPTVSRDGIVVASSKNQVYAFGLADGQLRWVTCDCDDGLETEGVPFVVADHVVVMEGYGPGAIPLNAEGTPRPAGLGMIKNWPGEPGDPLDPASVSVIAWGDALFMSFENGTVLSAYTP